MEIEPTVENRKRHQQNPEVSSFTCGKSFLFNFNLEQTVALCSSCNKQGNQQKPPESSIASRSTLVNALIVVVVVSHESQEDSVEGKESLQHERELNEAKRCVDCAE